MLLATIKRLQYDFDEASQYLDDAANIYPKCALVVVEQKRLVEEARRLYNQSKGANADKPSTAIASQTNAQTPDETLPSSPAVTMQPEPIPKVNTPIASLLRLSQKAAALFFDRSSNSANKADQNDKK